MDPNNPTNSNPDPTTPGLEPITPTLGGDASNSNPFAQPVSTTGGSPIQSPLSSADPLGAANTSFAGAPGPLDENATPTADPLSQSPQPIPTWPPAADVNNTNTAVEEESQPMPSSLDMPLSPIAATPGNPSDLNNMMTSVPVQSANQQSSAPVETPLDPLAANSNPMVNPTPQEPAPTNLSNIGAESAAPAVPPQNALQTQPETLVIPTVEQSSPTVATASSHGFPKVFIAVGILFVLIAAGASAYFIFGVKPTQLGTNSGDAGEESEVNQESNAPAFVPEESEVAPSPSSLVPSPATTSGLISPTTTVPQLSPTKSSTSSGSSAIELLRQRRVP